MTKPKKTEWHAIKRRELVREKGFVGLTVRYVCDARTFVHHVGPARSEESAWFFSEWWREHGGAEPVPATAAEAIARGAELGDLIGIRAGASDEWVYWEVVRANAFDYLATASIQ